MSMFKKLHHLWLLMQPGFINSHVLQIHDMTGSKRPVDVHSHFIVSKTHVLKKFRETVFNL